ncbi:Hint domain-containing protein [Rhodobacter aestuarii]|uniref:Hint domain-containing protein n=1 Tax=Rhodobacter aestuarii TaxID=453582 RepID=A0A1N7JUW3_9RHOB|nr:MULTISPECIES: Hint domain-containing protein [Rhodobacter]PTV95978.1 Hint domain-containing protein [Rhodobacter aestuarii]SIS53152.1 Hint domain-containing protein [Rhodobacter aestuarii]SOC10461.1 Hint domain-containing protein [Rhodobacter sp. JA431]
MTVFRDTFADVFHFDERMATTGQHLRGADEFLDLAQGLYGKTVLQTARGLRRVSSLIEGEEVRTFANGSRAIQVIERFPIERLQHPLPERFWPLALPAGLLGNNDRRLVAPEQCLLLHSELAQIEHDKPLLLVPAKVLSLLPQVTTVNPGPKAVLYRLRFEEPELVMSANGAVLLCDIGSMFDDWADLDPHDTLAHLPDVAALPFDEAFDLIQREIEIDGGIEAHFAKHLEQMKRCAVCTRVVAPPTHHDQVAEPARACRQTCPREWAAE